MSDYLGYEDERLPLVPKSSLQQYDNYQIHDLYCDDIEYVSIPESDFTPEPVKFKNFLAVEKVSPFGGIECNFEAIALMYP